MRLVGVELSVLAAVFEVQRRRLEFVLRRFGS
jgi:hypothetical protein